MRTLSANFGYLLHTFERRLVDKVYHPNFGPRLILSKAFHLKDLRHAVRTLKRPVEMKRIGAVNCLGYNR